MVAYSMSYHVMQTKRLYKLACSQPGRLRKQNRVVEKFYAKPKVFGFKFYAGLRVKEYYICTNSALCTCMCVHLHDSSDYNK